MNPNHRDIDEPYENITAAISMLRAASDLLTGHPLAQILDSASNELNDERIEILGNGRGRPFWFNEIQTPENPQ